MKTRKKELSTRYTYCQKGFEKVLMDKMKTEGATGYYKKGVFVTQIVWEGLSFMFPIKAKKKYADFKKGIYLFGMVRKDAKAFLANNPKFKLPKKNPSIYYNPDYREGYDGAITATDLNHAYWRIAFNLGIISERTYNHGLDESLKATRLAALSTMGMPKKYYMIKDGVLTDEMIAVGGDDKIAELYILIRHTCFNYMMDIRKILGDGFLAYKTDCVYYAATTENKRVVREYMGKKGLLYKQLV